MKKVRLPFSGKTVGITNSQEKDLLRTLKYHEEWKSKNRREREQEKKRANLPKTVHFPEPTKEPTFQPGDAVKLWSSDRRKEVGRVIANVWNSFIGTWDVYVGFFGFRWPSKNYLKMEYPYVLRYFETSLRPYTPKKETIR